MTSGAKATTELSPQPGPQSDFFTSQAEIVIYGGAAGAGKTFSLLAEPLRHVANPLFRGMLLRRTHPDLMQAGGLHDAATELYTQFGATYGTQKKRWTFPSGATIEYGHCERDAEKIKFQGVEVAYLGFDEVTHFKSGDVFWYLQTRLRSKSGVTPYVRATCNPDPDSFVRELIDWWLDDDGFPIPERSGVIRWFVRKSGQIEWADSPEDFAAMGLDPEDARSFTFIPGSLQDNKILQDINPEYERNLKSMSHAQMMQLLKGNWDVREVAGGMFEGWVEKPRAPAFFETLVRFWDVASSEVGDPTAGVLMGRIRNQYWVLDVATGRWAPGDRDDRMKAVAEQDWEGYDGMVQTVIERQPGAAGIDMMTYLSEALAQFGVTFDQPRKDKVTRAQPLAAQVKCGNVFVLQNAAWKPHFLNETAAFPTKGIPDDQVDAASGAFNRLFVDVTRVPGSYSGISQNSR